MELIDIQILNILQTIVMIIGTGVFTFVYSRRRQLKWWLLVYIFLSISLISKIFGNISESIYLLANLLRAIPCFLIFFAVFKDYKQTFHEVKKSTTLSSQKINAAMVISPMLLGLLYILIIIMIISSFMLIRICLRKRTPTYVFLTASIIGFSMVTLSTLFTSYELEGGEAISAGSTLLSVSLLLATGIAAFTEVKLTESQKILSKTIRNASLTSINVANIATELAANASEVNAAAEEISSTTQDTARTIFLLKESLNIFHTFR